MSKKEVTITRTVDGPVEKVWKAWTDPELVKKWWGPKDFTAPSIEIDLREGGKYLYCMRGSAGPDMPARDYWNGGVYQKIVPMEKIVVTDYFTDEKGNKVTPAYYGMGSDNDFEATAETMFEPQDGKTKITLHYPDASRFNEQDISNMQMGWSQSLDKFEEVLKEI